MPQLRALRKDPDTVWISRSAAILEWWWRQIKSAAPWSQADSDPPDALMIEVTEFTRAPPKLAGNILLRRNGDEEWLTALDPALALKPDTAASLTGLRLPAAMTLHRRLTLPAMAQHHLQTTIGFEMDRLTPFAPADVFWSISELTRDRQNLKLMLVIVPRSIVEPLLAALHRLNIAPSFIESAFGRIPLAAPRVRPAKPARDTLIGLCCTFTLAIALAPLVQQQRQIDQANRQLKTLMPEQQALSALNQELARLESRHLIAAAAQENGDELQILAALTNALPTGTWLSNLTMTPSEITLTGQSNDAASLISALTASSAFHNPSFIGPMTRTQDGSTMFFIQASISK